MKLRNLLVLLLTLFAGLILPAWRGALETAAEEGAVIMEIQPQTSVVSVGAEFTVRVMIRSGEQLVDAAQVFIDFDPAILEALEVIPSPDLPQELPLPIPKIDNQAGQINYVAGKLLGQLPSGVFTVMSIRMRALQLTVGAPLTIVKRRALSATSYLDTAVSSEGQRLSLTLNSGRVIVAMPTATPSPEPTSTPSGRRIHLPLLLRAFWG
jgi:hypothetical protein